MLPNLRQELEKIALAQDYIEAGQISDVLIDQLKQLPDAISAVPIILEFMEQHPTFDFGVPGPLVHFAEKFYRKGYEDMLCVSFARRPTVHTVLMMHRLINGTSGELKQKYIGFLELASRRQDIDESSRDSALQYFKYHTEGK
jgi:hypothetical protein